MSAKLVSVQLSENPAATTVKDARGINGKLNQTSDKRLYAVLKFEDTANPFKVSRAVRVYGTNQADKFPGLTPKELMGWVGKVIPGARFETRAVEPYQIEGNDAQLTSYTTVVLPHENVVSVFERAGHTIVSEEATIDAGVKAAAEM